MSQNRLTAKSFQCRAALPLFSFTLLLVFGFAHSVAAAPLPQGEILGKERTADFTRSKTNWSSAVIGQKLLVEDRVRTRELSRAILQLAELGRLQVDELTTLEILPPRTESEKPTVDLKQGAIYFFTRDKPREFRIQTPNALAASDGTEFLVTIEPGGRVVFTVFDGRVELSNPLGTVLLANGEQGEAVAGLPPRKLAAIEAVNLVQWWLYYPGVLDTDEVPLPVAERAVLAASINNYRQGDLLAALDTYPAGRVPQTDAEKIYYAGLLLAVGQVDKAEAQLAAVPTQPALAAALRQVIAAVNLRPFTNTVTPATATEWLAKSYHQQSRFDLRGALESARAAAGKSTNFGFAWARVAELEFSFRRTDAALNALREGLQLSPRNAQAWALKGFLEAANNHLTQATNAFQTAINLDSALGNGWLGRGLVRIRSGDATAGRADLQTAAAMEPNRSVLRSYLGKAFDNLGAVTSAEKELLFAKRLDAADPTPWLYSALLLRQQLRFNEALDDLELSVELNDNRRVYRSRLLLDEDRAVRSSSLATIYQSVGMNDVSVREAARAVTADYANPSAHLFLAESFNALRDPTRFNLRIETAWFNELLLANILAPVGGGNLSQNISQQEYSRLFEANRVGFSSFTEGRSDGQIRELASQFGTVGGLSYSLDLDYQHNNGVRPNNHLDRVEWYTTVKQQITPQDSILLLTKYQDYHSGDNFQYYNPATDARKHFTYDEFQKPLAVVAYHREWSPGVHTLILAGRLENDQRLSDQDVHKPILTTSAGQVVFVPEPQSFNEQYRGEFEIFTGELNQIIQGERFHLVLGGRFQTGNFTTSDRLSLPAGSVANAPFFVNLPAVNSVRDNFERLSGYGYYTLQVAENLHITTGLSYDQITFPINHRASPLLGGSETRDQISPKAAVTWSPVPAVTFRGVYSQALGGVSFDESFRLEPVQLAGFNQAYRTLISESVVGSVSAPTYEIIGGAMDVKLATRTYFGVQVQALNSRVRTHVGVFIEDGDAPSPPPITPYALSSTPLQYYYAERSIAASLHQLVDEEWAFGARYKFTASELGTDYPAIPRASGFEAFHKHERADLHQATFSILFNHRSGFFARSETDLYHQDNSGYTPALPATTFVQQNIFIGYRLRRQRGEISVGVLNVSDTDYHLNPLNLYAELPRERTYVARLKFNF